jgi:hypothetical protein
MPNAFDLSITLFFQKDCGFSHQFFANRRDLPKAPKGAYEKLEALFPSNVELPTSKKVAQYT